MRRCRVLHGGRRGSQLLDSLLGSDGSATTESLASAVGLPAAGSSFWERRDVDELVLGAGAAGPAAVATAAAGRSSTADAAWWPPTQLTPPPLP